MKVTRRMLLWITAGLGALLIMFSILRHFKIVELDDKIERYFMDGVIFAALALFMYNRKLAKDERKAREEAEQERIKAEQGEVEEAEAEAEDDENLPHWERKNRDGEES